MIRELRLLAVLGGVAAFLLHFGLGMRGGWATIVLKYLCLPPMVWLQRTGAARWATAAFAFVFGVCVVDEALSWGRP